MSIKIPTTRKKKEHKPCDFCGNNYLSNHCHSCLAKNFVCKSCGDKGHIVKVCKYRKNVDNIDEKSEDTAEEECNSITSDNESELSVLKIPTSGSLSQQNNSIQ